MALNKMVTISSFVQPYTTTSLATDGQLISDTAATGLTEYCVMTALESAPWLAVDLEEDQYITHVVIATKPNLCCKSQAVDTVEGIYVLLSSCFLNAVYLISG